MQHTVIIPGSFDPPSNGHLNIIERALDMFDHVIVAVARNNNKHSLLSSDERVALLQEIFKSRNNVTVETFQELTAEYARRKGVRTIVRGIRNMTDFEYESQLAAVNRSQYTELDTVFLLAEGNNAHISSSIVKDVIRLGGDASKMLHPVVEAAMRKKL